MKRIVSIFLALVLICGLLPGQCFAAENPVPKAKQAVVLVYSGIYYENGRGKAYDPRGYFGQGTAFGVYAEDNGALVFATNAHVVCDDNNKAYENVYICVDGADVSKRSTVIECEILYVDTRIDVAIIRAEAPIRGVGTLPLRYAEELETGDGVFALGYPGISDETADRNDYTAEDITVTDGIVSRYMTSSGVKCMAHTATVNHGNSGGPLIDDQGNAIGINTFIHADEATADLRCYAIYIDYVVEALDELQIPYELTSRKDSLEPERPTDPVSPPEVSEVPEPGTHQEEGLPMSTLLLILGFVALCGVLVVIVLVARKKSGKNTPKVQEPQVTVYAITGPMQGQSWPLAAVLTVGRDYNNSIVYPPDTRGISRSHCRIERRGPEILVTDMGSTYGTFVGGRKLIPQVPMSVGMNAEIGLGGEKIKLLIR